MTVRSSILVIAATGLGFACLGGLIGVSLGIAAPGYYRAVFPRVDAANFSPVQIGLGLGITQGGVCGLALSLIAVGLFASRNQTAEGPSLQATSEAADCAEPESNLPKSGWTIRLLGAGGLTVVIGLIAVSIFVLGAVVGQQAIYRNWTQQTLTKLAAILDSGEFHGVTAGYSSAAQVYLTGTVHDYQTRDALRNRLIDAYGRDEAEIICRTFASVPESLRVA